MLVVWDTLFSVDPTFKLIDLICTAMLLRIRWDCKYNHLSFSCEKREKGEIGLPKPTPKMVLDVR